MKQETKIIHAVLTLNVLRHWSPINDSSWIARMNGISNV